jgi:hypothetical protein
MEEKFMKKAMITLLAVALTGLVAYAAANISGAWDFTMTTQRGETKSVVTFVQTGEKLAVTVAGVGRDGQPTETKGEGTIKGNDVTWKIVRETQRGTFESTYKGTLVDDNNMKGTMEFGGGMGNPPGGGQMTPPEWKAVRKAK